MLIELAKQWLTYRLATLAAPLDIVNHSNDPNTVKVVFDVNSKAMYFSRSNIPYCSQEVTQGYQHLGLYMYSVAQLRHYVTLQPTIGENTEKLEQLRFIENGFTMGISVTNLASVSVNQFSDIAKLEAHILASTS
jgi:3-deoxy-manno-octulosonate cytidylyltransferase (CMP-KDO synthetase)